MTLVKTVTRGPFISLTNKQSQPGRSILFSTQSGPASFFNAVRSCGFFQRSQVRLAADADWFGKIIVFIEKFQ